MRNAVMLGVLFFLFSPKGFAQYYEEPEHEPLSGRYAYAGFMQRSFTPSSSNPLGDSARIDFSRIMPVIGFHQAFFDIMFGYTKYSLQGQDKSAILLGLSISNEFVLSGKRPSTLLLPLMLSSDYTKAEGTGSEKDDFNVGSVGIGAGLKYRYYSESFEFTLQAVEAVHFSFEGIGAGNGFSAATLGDVLIVFKQHGIIDGIVLGYKFRYQTWNMNSNRFDYKSVSHGPYVGVMF